MEEAKSAATKEAQKSKEEEESFRAAAAEDLSRCEQQLREKSERCRTLELELKQARPGSLAVQALRLRAGARRDDAL